MAIGTLELARPTRGEPTELIAPTTTLAAEVSNLRNQRDKDRLSGVLLRSRVTGASAWKWFQRIGEIHYALTRAAKIAGYAKISACKLSPQGTVEDLIDTGLAADIIQGVYSRVGGTRGLIERYFLQQKIAAESHLIRWMDGRTQDGYMFVSSKELSDGTTAEAGIAIESRAKSFALKMTTMPNVANLNGAFERTIAQKDYLGRVWTPSPEWLDVPESPLGALDRQCDMLDTMTRNMHASMKSRFAIAGIMYFSNKVREAYGGTKVDGKTVLQILYDLMKQNLISAEDTADVTSILPILMMGDAEPGKVMEHLTIDRAIFETDLQLRSELIDRILFGLDVNAPATEGNKETSHWGSWNNAADELRLAVIPDLDGFCWTTDRLILRPTILAEKGDANLKADVNKGLIGVTFELDEASVRANRAADARELRKQGLLGGIPALKAGGFNAGDLMDVVEYIQWVGVQLRIPEMACWGRDGSKTKADVKNIEWDKWMPQKAGPKTGPGGDEPSGPGEGDPGSPDDTDDDTPAEDKPI